MFDNGMIGIVADQLGGKDGLMKNTLLAKALRQGKKSPEELTTAHQVMNRGRSGAFTPQRYRK